MMVIEMLTNIFKLSIHMIMHFFYLQIVTDGLQ